MTCKQCGMKLPGTAPHGLCPRCLAAMGLRVLREELSPEASGSQLEAAQPLAVPKSIRYFGDYELLEELARGGMGIVYKARQCTLNRLVALKMLPFGQLAGEEFVRRFRAEAEAVASLQHPNIVAVHEVGQHEGQHYFSMDYVEGQTLAQLAENHPLSPELAGEYVKNIALAVQYAHDHGVLHRDLKPSNVLIDRMGKPRITDFGLAKRLHGGPDLTQTGQILGTPNYMAPEQARGKSGVLGPAADVYSLGAVLYYLLTGRPPFLAQTLESTVRRVLHDEPVPPRLLTPSTPRDLQTICLKCLEKEPNRRYGSAGELAKDLDHWLQNKPITARPATQLVRALKWMRRKPAVAGLSFGIALLLVIVAVGSTIAAFRIDKSRRAEVVAKELATTAQGKAMEKLWESYLAQARANRLSARPGRYFDTMETIAKAAAIRPSPELRNEAIACLALDDARVVPGGEVEWPYMICFDSSLEVLARIMPTGDISISRVNDNQQLSLIPARDVGVHWLLGFTRTCRYLAFADGSDRTCVWDIEMNRMVLSGLNQAVISPAEDSLAVGHGDGSVSIYDLTTGQSRPVETRASKRARPAAFDPTGIRLACFNDATLKVEVLNVLSNASLVTCQLGDDCRYVAWSSDGRLLAMACQNGSVYIMDAHSGKLLRTLVGHEDVVNRVSFNRAGTLLASTGWDDTVRLWDPFDGSQLLRIPGQSYQLHFGPDDQRLGFVWAGKQFGLLQLARHPEYLHLRALESRAAAMFPSFSPDGQWLGTVVENRVNLWELSAGSTAALLPEQGVWGFVFAPDGKSLITSGIFGLARWPVRREAVGDNDQITLGPREAIAATTGQSFLDVSISADGTRLVAGGANGSEAWMLDLTRQEKVVLLGPHPRVRCAAISPNGRWIATGTWQGTGVKIWDTTTAKLAYEIPEPSHANTLFSPDGHWLMIGSPDGYSLHETGNWRPGPIISLPLKNYLAGAMAFSDDSQVIAVANGGRTVRLLETITGKLFADFEAPTLALVRGLAFSRDSRRLVASDALGQVHVWDLSLIRERLSKLGLDWEMPPYQTPREKPHMRPLRFETVADGTEYQRVAFFNNRAHALASKGLWKEAALEVEKGLALQPGEHFLYHTLAPLLVAMEDNEGYRKLCERIVVQFGITNHSGTQAQAQPAGSLLSSGSQPPEVFERMAKDCLILPSTGVDLRVVGQMADQALSSGQRHRFLPYFQCAKGLSEYRLGNFEAAITWAQQSLTGTNPWDYFRHVEARMVMAMAYYKLARLEEAQTQLAKGLQTAKEKLPQRETDDYGDDWRDWIIAHALMKEARALLEPDRALQTKP